LRRAGRIRAPTDGGLPPVNCIGASPMWDVLRWFSVFVIAVLVMVAGLYWILGKPLPIPSLF